MGGYVYEFMRDNDGRSRTTGLAKESIPSTTVDGAVGHVTVVVTVFASCNINDGVEPGQGADPPGAYITGDMMAITSQSAEEHRQAQMFMDPCDKQQTIVGRVHHAPKQFGDIKPDEYKRTASIPSFTRHDLLKVISDEQIKRRNTGTSIWVKVAKNYGCT